MKFVFFLTLLINITFFLWEYRQGAPLSYLPQQFEYSTSDAQKIILLSRPPQIQKEMTNSKHEGQDQSISPPEQQPDTDNLKSTVAFVGPVKLPDPANKTVAPGFMGPVYQQTDDIQKDKKIVPVASPPQQPLEPKAIPEIQQTEVATAVNSSRNSDNIQPTVDIISTEKLLVACYHLKKTATKQGLIAKADSEQKYTLAFAEQKEAYTSNYLVLTLAADTLQQAKNRQETLRQQGISDLWMFKKGAFKWRISLGLFSTPEKAASARKQYASLTTESLEVIPSRQTRTVTQVTLQAQEKQMIANFAKKFSPLITQEVDCLSID